MSSMFEMVDICAFLMVEMSHKFTFLYTYYLVVDYLEYPRKGVMVQ
jgi:hypothetical protein